MSRDREPLEAKPHVHDFDPVSGWCSGCTVRDDGRHAWRGTIQQHGPAYTPDQIAEFLERARS